MQIFSKIKQSQKSGGWHLLPLNVGTPAGENSSLTKYRSNYDACLAHCLASVYDNALWSKAETELI
jgi:hypothetical protein